MPKKLTKTLEKSLCSSEAVRKLLDVARKVAAIRAAPTILYWRWVIPKQSRASRLHRFVFLRLFGELQLYLRLFLVTLLYVRWYFWLAPQQIYALLKRHNCNVRWAVKVSRARLLTNSLRLSYLYAIPPAVYLSAELYKRPRNTWLDLIYDFQASRWHSAFISKRYAEVTQHRMLLSNKYEFEKVMTGCGLVCTKTLLRLHKAEKISADQIDLLPGEFFVKPVSENQSLACYTISNSRSGALDSHYSLRHIKSSDLITGASSIQVSQIISSLNQSYELLLQELIPPHSKLFNLLGEHSAVVRVITFAANTPLAIARFAFFEIKQYSHSTRRAVYSINVETGASNWFDVSEGHLKEDRAQSKLVQEIIAENWGRVIDLVVAAHRAISPFPSVAWDLAITDSEPVLIEGNSHWAVELPQMLSAKAMLTVQSPTLADYESFV